jgi:hypothetical protein
VHSGYVMLQDFGSLTVECAQFKDGMNDLWLPKNMLLQSILSA